jgi:hypothetical protein
VEEELIYAFLGLNVMCTALLQGLFVTCESWRCMNGRRKEKDLFDWAMSVKVVRKSSRDSVCGRQYTTCFHSFDSGPTSDSSTSY